MGFGCLIVYFFCAFFLFTFARSGPGMINRKIGQTNISLHHSFFARPRQLSSEKDSGREVGRGRGMQGREGRRGRLVRQLATMEQDLPDTQETSQVLALILP